MSPRVKNYVVLDGGAHAYTLLAHDIPKIASVAAGCLTYSVSCKPQKSTLCCGKTQNSVVLYWGCEHE